MRLVTGFIRLQALRFGDKSFVNYNSRNKGIRKSKPTDNTEWNVDQAYYAALLANSCMGHLVHILNNNKNEAVGFIPISPMIIDQQLVSIGLNYFVKLPFKCLHIVT